LLALGQNSVDQFDELFVGENVKFVYECKGQFIVYISEKNFERGVSFRPEGFYS